MYDREKEKERFTLPEGIEVKEEGRDVRIYLYRESFGLQPDFGVYLYEEDTLFDSYAIYLHTYRQKGKGRIILDVKNHSPLPGLISDMTNIADEVASGREYFFFLYRCFSMQRQYDWFLLSDRIQAVVDRLPAFIKENHMTCTGYSFERSEAERKKISVRKKLRQFLAEDGRLKRLGEGVPDVLYDNLCCCMFALVGASHIRKRHIPAHEREWLMDNRMDLWGIKDGVLYAFIFHMQKEEESLAVMLQWGNYMKDIFAKEEEALFQQRIMNPKPSAVWHGWEEVSRVKVILLSASPAYEMYGELLSAMNEGSEKTGISYEFKYIPSETEDKISNQRKNGGL